MGEFFAKVYLSNEAERKLLEELATAEGLSVSAYIKSRLPLPSASKFQQALAETIRLAEALDPQTEFAIPDLYSPLAWKQLSADVNTGQLGRRFYEQVSKGNVEGVSFVRTDNRRTIYRKDA